MKKTSIPIILLLVLSALNITTTGYVLQCPGTVHLNTYQDMNFSDCVNSSYFEFGPDYFWLSSMNFTRTSLTSSTESKSMIFYFDDYDAANAWNSNPENMVDGDYGTFATETLIDDKVQILTNNTVFGDGVGSIDTVEIRLFGIFAFSGKVDIQPVFTGGDGTYITGLNPAGDYTSWYDITTDTNAPATWGWDDVSNMDCNIRADSPTAPNICKVSIVEIRVTYSYSNYYRLSFFNDTLNNHTANDLPYRFFEFNGTFHDTGAYDFTMDLPESNYLIDFYADNVIMYNDVDETSGLYYFPYNFTSGTTTMFTFYIDGYRPTCPSNASVTYDGVSNTFNFTWYNTSGADTFVLVNKSGDYPSSPTDGTIVQNNSWTYFNSTLTETSYFSLWVYNNSGRYSPDSCKLDFTWGAITIYAVYNESNPSQDISPFGLLISNVSGTQTYWNSTVVAPIYIDKTDIPYGVNTLLTINASGYKTTNYYFDFYVNNFYNLTLFMPPDYTVVPPGGGDEGDANDTHLTTRQYTFYVIDEYDTPIPNVKCNIKFYNNLTEQWDNKTIAITDGYGMAQVDLVPNTNYKIFLTKDGYEQTGSNDWKPEAYSIYDTPPPKPFRMNGILPDIETREFWDIITFYGVMHSNGSLYIYFEDETESTTNAQFDTFEVNVSDITYLERNETTDNTDFFWITGCNSSRVHRIEIHINNTIIGYYSTSIIIQPYITPGYDEEQIEGLFVGVFGEYTLGYVNFFLIFIPMIVLLLIFGPRHAGLGIIGAGLYIGFTSMFLTVPSGLLVLVPLIVAIGFIYTLVKHGGTKI